MGILEKIKELEEEYKKTQKNKATEHHLGIIKAKIAKLKRNLIKKSSSKSGSGFNVRKSGNATVALIGFPSVGKSTLLNALTGAKTKIGHYAFTTLTCIPGIMKYKHANIQILDLPGIIKGAKEGKGRGKEVIAAARNSDLILIITNAKQYDKESKAIINELEGVGIRLNKKPKDIHISKKIKGGITINTTTKLTKINKKTIISILNEYGIHNADVVIRDNINIDELIDYLEANRVYIPAIFVANKIDECSEEEKERINKNFIRISAKNKKNIEELKEIIFQKLNFIRIYTKRKGEEIDNEPMMIRKGSTIKHVCIGLHRDLLKQFKYALVWGKSVKFPGQRVGLEHVLKDGDIVQIIKK